MSESSDLKTSRFEKHGARLERMPGTNEPLFVDITEHSAPRPGEPFVERNAILAIVKDPVTGKYLGLEWKTTSWKTFVTGGVEEGQSAEEAAREEVRQESGYKNMRLVKQLGNIHSKFYHGHKKENRFAHFTVLYFELIDQERDELSEEEKLIHEPTWLSPEKVETFGLPAAHLYSWDELMGT